MVDLMRLPDAALIAVRCAPAVLDVVDGALSDWPFPRDANRFATVGETTIVWTGPEDWLIIAAATELSALLTRLEAQFAGHHAAVVDISGNRVRFQLSGSRARAMMARACALDLDPPHFRVGQCAGTVVARTQAFVLQRDDAPTYEILVRRSYARYLSDWFDTAGKGVSEDSGVQLFQGSGAILPHLA